MKHTDPVFICGALRSGSTVFHLMLDHHPDIKNPGEFDFMFDLIGDEGSFPEAKKYHEWLKIHRIFQSTNLVIDPDLIVCELIRSFATQLTNQNAVLSLNIHRNFHRIPFVFPDAKYIHLLRDPRDVAKSSIGMGWAGNVYFGVDHWLETEASWDRLAEKIKPEQALTVYYEELINTPEETLKKICRFLDIPYTSTMLDYSNNSTYSKPDSSLIRQWEKKFSQREIQYVEAKASQLMVTRGFALSGHPLIQVGIMEKILLGMQNKWFKLNHGITRYGCSLFFIEKLARILGLEKLRQRCIIKRNVIDIKYLK